MIELRPAAARGQANFGWLRSAHTFSFGEYFDAAQQGFSDLRVINDDRVEPGQGFDTHGHRDMEIISYVLDGALAHRDSIGNGSVIRPGDVQVMSAGSGIRHSEYNASERDPVHFLQIWIVPDQRGGVPGYQQKHFAEAERRGALRLIVSPDGQDGSLRIHQDARIYVGEFEGDEAATLPLAAGRHAYVHVARGNVCINGQRMAAGDGARLRDEAVVEVGGGETAEVLVFDLRGKELPGG
jgi:redox-sensitive bicupin YhaK (pirin superfamily)